MEKKVEYTIPAQPARPAKKAEKVVKVCDFCGDSAKRESYGYGGGECCLCGRDVCRKHKDWDPHELGDYPDTYCFICIELKFKKYWATFTALEEEYDRKVKKLEAKIKKEALLLKTKEGL